MTTLIKNGTLVLSEKMVKADLTVQNGVIARIGKPDCEADHIIDASGLHVMAGFVDMHCHLREPGQTHKEDIQSGAVSALHGGFTSIACMPNTTPPLDDPALVSYVAQRGRTAGGAKVYPIGCISKGMAGKALCEFGAMKAAGAVGVSDDGKPVSDGGLMRRAIEYASDFGLAVISHCEDLSLVCGGLVNEGANATSVGLAGISRASEESMIAREILISMATGKPVHIAHVSTRGGVEMIRLAKARGARITAETCPHYLSLTDSEILSFNTNAKINPPLRTPDDVKAVIEGLVDRTIDAIATDHAPHHHDEKNREFALAPSGTTGFETAFAVCFSHLVKTKKLSLPRLSQLLSDNPAQILGLGARTLAANQPADITIVDTKAEYTIDTRIHKSKARNCVFEGMAVTGRVVAVLIDGETKLNIIS